MMPLASRAAFDTVSSSVGSIWARISAASARSAAASVSVSAAFEPSARCIARRRTLWITLNNVNESTRMLTTPSTVCTARTL
jgi:hypothetical protein